MGRRKIWIIVGIILLVAVGATAYLFFQNKESQEPEPIPQTQITESTTDDIIKVVGDTEDLSTLSGAIEAAELTTTLQAAGPFTMLAPTNNSFNDLPSGTLDSLLKPENQQALKNILTYHIIQGKVLAKDLTNGQRLKTVNGQEIIVEVTNGKLYFVDAKGNKASVNKADVATSNGVIHVVNAVLLPQ